MSVHNKLYVKTELFTPRVDGTDFSTADWGFLGTIDQNLSKADEVEFNSITYNNGSNTTKIQSGATSDYTLTLPIDDGVVGDVLVTDGSGILSWASLGGNPFDQSLNTTDNSQFVNLTLTGDLTVQGTTTIINTTDTEIKDNVIILNSGETGAGVGSGTGTSGIEIDRGTEDNVLLNFDETTDKWTVGSVGAIGTNRFIISELADASHTQGSIPGFDVNGRLAESEGLTSSEVDQLQNIDLVTISNIQWGHLGALDQGLSSADDVVFNDLTVNGDLTLSSPIAVSVSATLTTDPNPIEESINIFNTSGGVISPTLPDNSSSIGKTYIIYLQVAGNDLTVTCAGSDTIEGSATMVLNTAPQHLRLTSAGDGVWLIT